MTGTPDPPFLRPANFAGAFRQTRRKTTLVPQLSSAFGPARRLGDGWVYISAFGPLGDTEIYGSSSLEPVSSKVPTELRTRVKGPDVVVGWNGATLDDTPARSRVFSGPDQHRERPDCSSTTVRIPEPCPKPATEASKRRVGACHRTPYDRDAAGNRVGDGALSRASAIFHFIDF